jgi:hypothetical protein
MTPFFFKGLPSSQPKILPTNTTIRRPANETAQKTLSSIKKPRSNSLSGIL